MVNAGAASFSLDAPFLRSAALARLMEAIVPVGEARVVGGAIRNTLLGEPVGDIDVATVAHPPEVARAAAAAGLGVHATGIEHGTLTVVADGHPFEVTTLREDVSTDGRRATVRFTTDWARDAARRDFTMNALYLDRAGNGTDFVGGYADCLARRVRFIGDPDQRILEDHLRILRFFRFNAAYAEGAPDAAGIAAARRHRDRLADLSAERVAHELFRILVAPRAADMLEVMSADGFIDRFVPPPHDVAAVRALAEAERGVARPQSAALAFAALAGADAAQFGEAARVLKFSRRDRERGLAAIAAMPSMPPRSVPQMHAMLYDLGPEAFGDALLLAVARGAEAADLPGALAAAKGWSRPRFPVTGHDLLKQGGAPGPHLGERLARLEDAWRRADFSLARESLLALDRARLSGDEG